MNPARILRSQPCKAIQLESPLPEFAEEFVYHVPKSATRKRYHYDSKRPLIPSAPVSVKSSSKKLILTPSKSAIKSKSKSQLLKSDCKESTLHKILRLYRPQVMKFKEKTHIQVFTTVSPAVRKSKAQLQRSLKLLNDVHRKKKKPPKELSIEVLDKPLEYKLDFGRPAITYGEKLWKLNEITMINLEV